MVGSSTIAAKRKEEYRIVRLAENAYGSFINAARIFDYKGVDERSSRGRAENTVMLVEHAFEMLLQAAIMKADSIAYATTVASSRKRTKHSSFKHAIELCLVNGRTFTPPLVRPAKPGSPTPKSHPGQTTPVANILTDDMGKLLFIITNIRNEAQHEVCQISDELMYLLMRSSAIIFNKVMSFIGRDMKLPTNIVPVVTTNKLTMESVIAEGFDKIRNTSKREEAQAILKTYIAIEQALTTWAHCNYSGDGLNQHLKWQPVETDRLLSKLRAKTQEVLDWRTLFPYVACLSVNNMVNNRARQKNTYIFSHTNLDEKYPFAVAHIVAELGTALSATDVETILDNSKVVAQTSEMFARFVSFQLRPPRTRASVTYRPYRNVFISRYSREVLEALKRALAASSPSNLLVAARNGNVDDLLFPIILYH